jgi:hypothetical protein
MRFILFFTLLLGVSSLAQAETMPVDSTWKAYTGVYKLAANGMIDTYTVTYEDGKLFGQANGYDKTQLSPQAEPRTFVSGYGSMIVFMYRAEKKMIDQVKLVVQGNEVMGVKE